MSDLAIHRRALDLLLSAAAGPVDRSAPTPCSDWNLGQLLDHVTGQHHGLLQNSADLADWAPRHLHPPLSAAALQEALEHAGGERWMPRVRPDAPLPLTSAVRVHALDTLVHAWDVARAAGRPDPAPDEELLSTAEAVAARTRPGPDFAEPLAVEQDGRFPRLLAGLGRDPRWGR